KKIGEKPADEPRTAFRTRAVDDLGRAGVDHGHGVADGARAVGQLGIDDEDDALLRLADAAAQHRAPAIAVAAVEDADGELEAGVVEELLDRLERGRQPDGSTAERHEHRDGRAHTDILARTLKVWQSRTRRWRAAPRYDETTSAGRAMSEEREKWPAAVSNDGRGDASMRRSARAPLTRPSATLSPRAGRGVSNSNFFQNAPPHFR